MAPSSASLTTFFVVGPEEYVEFAESMGSKAFLQHIWDNSVTPLARHDLDGRPRLHNTGARIVHPENGPPRIEFPTVKRIRGNRYKPTGKWISWQALKRLNPLAITDPPDLAVFLARGGTVGTGERRAPGAYLEQTSSKNLIPFAVPEEADASGQADAPELMESLSYTPSDQEAAQQIPTGTATPPPRQRTNKPSLNVDSQGWIGVGSAQSIHAPPRAVVVRRARQTSSPAILAAKAALAASASRPGPSPLSNSAMTGRNDTVTPGNAHLLRTHPASGTPPPGSPSALSHTSPSTPTGTPPARTAPRFSHGASASVSGPGPFGTPPSASQAFNTRSAVSTPPPRGSPSLHSTPGSAGSSGSASGRASRRPNLRMPMPPPPQHLSCSFRTAAGEGASGAAEAAGLGGAAVGGATGSSSSSQTSGMGSASVTPASFATFSSSGPNASLTPGALTPGHAAGARTPLSATHPPPETPLKHQRRRAKESAALAAAAVAAAGANHGADDATAGSKVRAQDEVDAPAEAPKRSGKLKEDGNAYVEGNDERNPMDYATPLPATVAAAASSSAAVKMSPSTSASGGNSTGLAPGASPRSTFPTPPGFGVGGGFGLGSGAPDLRSLANLNRADVERTRLAFERTAAGQDPLLSASANARPIGGAAHISSPYSMWSPGPSGGGGPLSAAMSTSGSGGGGGGGVGAGSASGPGVGGGSAFGSWGGLGDWTSTSLNATTAAAMVVAIAEVRRSSLPPLTPATEGAPYSAAALGLPPVRSPGVTYDEEGPSGIGLGLEPGPPLGRPSRPSLYGPFLETPPNGTSSSASSIRQPASPSLFSPIGDSVLSPEPLPTDQA